MWHAVLEIRNRQTDQIYPMYIVFMYILAVHFQWPALYQWFFWQYFKN